MGKATEAVILKLIMEIGEIEQEKISLESSFEELGFDSIRYISLIVEIEEQFDINVTAFYLDYKNGFTVQSFIEEMIRSIEGK